MSFSNSLQKTIAKMEANGTPNTAMGELVKQLASSMAKTDAQLEAMKAASLLANEESQAAAQTHQ